MAKCYQGVFGNYSGRIGNVVARIRQGRTVLSIYQHNVLNPRTSSQMAVRSKFALLSRAFSVLHSAVADGFHDLDGYETGNYYSSAIGYNYRNDPFSGTYPNLTIDKSKLMIAQGVVDLPFSPACSADAETFTISWSDNSGLGNAEATDAVAVCIFNSAKRECVYTRDNAVRSDRTCEITVPTSWTGDSVDVYIFMRRNWSCSKSLHLGEFTV